MLAPYSGRAMLGRSLAGAQHGWAPLKAGAWLQHSEMRSKEMTKPETRLPCPLAYGLAHFIYWDLFGVRKPCLRFVPDEPCSAGA